METFLEYVKTMEANDDLGCRLTLMRSPEDGWVFRYEDENGKDVECTALTLDGIVKQIEGMDDA